MNNIPTITRNLLLINIICFLVQQVLQLRGINVTDWLGLHFVLASQFNVLQLISYMFLHGSWTHLFFNMFSLWMFGRIIETTLGAKRYLLYYMVCGIGAGLCQELWQTADYFINNLSAYEMVDTGRGALMPMSQFLNSWTTIGASGACYGILLAFGALFPNERIMLLIPPIPMKAKYFVAGYAAIELFSAYTSNDNVAHFAHLGGMLFGWLLLRYWRKQTRQRQQFSGWQTWPNEQQRHSSWWQRLQRIFKKNETGNAHHTATRESDYEYNMRSKQEEARMDEILDKIHRSGYDSLTPDEKKELFRISRR